MQVPFLTCTRGPEKSTGNNSSTIHFGGPLTPPKEASGLRWVPEIPPDKQRLSERLQLCMLAAKPLGALNKLLEKSAKTVRGAVGCPLSL